MDQGDFMKLYNPFNVLPKCLTAFNRTGLNLTETPKELEEYILEFQTFWNKNVEKIQLIRIV